MLSVASPGHLRPQSDKVPVMTEASGEAPVLTEASGEAPVLTEANGEVPVTGARGLPVVTEPAADVDDPDAPRPAKDVSDSPSGVARSSPARARSTSASSCDFLFGKTAVVFMHTYPTKTNGWRSIFDDQIAALRSSVLARCGVVVHLGLPPGTPWPLPGPPDKLPPPAIVPTVPSPRTAGGSKYEEVNTLSSLYEYCAAHPDELVAYIHDKGTRKVKADPTGERARGQWDWRKLHEYFLLEVPQRCVAELALGRYDSCGVGWKEKPHPHYRGNFWWATCAHVASLRHMADFKMPSPWHLDWSPEMWIGSERRNASDGGSSRGSARRRGRPLNCFSSNVDHYKRLFPRALYAGKPCAPDVPPPPQLLLAK